MFNAVGAGNDTIHGGAGVDLIHGGDGNDILTGDADDDIMYGGAGADDVNGGTGNDSILGDAGNDTMTAGSGFDYIYGGTGADLFAYRVGDFVDNIWDFSAAEGDKLRLDPAFGVTDVNDFKSRLTGFQSGGVDFSVFTSGADQITIAGIATTAWTAGQFEIG